MTSPILPLLITLRDCPDAELLDRLAVLADALEDAWRVEDAVWVRGQKPIIKYDDGSVLEFKMTPAEIAANELLSDGKIGHGRSMLALAEETWFGLRSRILERLSDYCECMLFIHNPGRVGYRANRDCPTCSGHGIILREPASA